MNWCFLDIFPTKCGGRSCRLFYEMRNLFNLIWADDEEAVSAGGITKKVITGVNTTRTIAVRDRQYYFTSNETEFQPTLPSALIPSKTATYFPFRSEVEKLISVLPCAFV